MMFLDLYTMICLIEIYLNGFCLILCSLYEALENDVFCEQFLNLSQKFGFFVRNIHNFNLLF